MLHLDLGELQRQHPSYQFLSIDGKTFALVTTHPFPPLDDAFENQKPVQVAVSSGFKRVYLPPRMRTDQICSSQNNSRKVIYFMRPKESDSAPPPPPPPTRESSDEGYSSLILKQIVDECVKKHSGDENTVTLTSGITLTTRGHENCSYTKVNLVSLIKPMLKVPRNSGIKKEECYEFLSRFWDMLAQSDSTQTAGELLDRSQNCKPAKRTSTRATRQSKPEEPFLLLMFSHGEDLNPKEKKMKKTKTRTQQIKTDFHTMVEDYVLPFLENRVFQKGTGDYTLIKGGLFSVTLLMNEKKVMGQIAFKIHSSGTFIQWVGTDPACRKKQVASFLIIFAQMVAQLIPQSAANNSPHILYAQLRKEDEATSGKGGEKSDGDAALKMYKKLKFVTVTAFPSDITGDTALNIYGADPGNKADFEQFEMLSLDHCLWNETKRGEQCTSNMSAASASIPEYIRASADSIPEESAQVQPGYTSTCKEESSASTEDAPVDRSITPKDHPNSAQPSPRVGASNGCIGVEIGVHPMLNHFPVYPGDASLLKELVMDLRYNGDNDMKLVSVMFESTVVCCCSYSSEQTSQLDSIEKQPANDISTLLL
jgi:hypothetical protein